MKQAISKVTGLQVGYTTEWVVLDNGEWRTLTEEENTLAEEEYQTSLNEQTKSEITSAIQSMLDAKAKELRYDNMMSARSYAGYTNPFQEEAQALAVWCANCWKKAGELEALGTVASVEEVLAQMPGYGVV